MNAAAERREARRRKILENADLRMNKILGVEGKDQNDSGGEGSPYYTRSVAAKMKSPSSSAASPESHSSASQNYHHSLGKDDENENLVSNGHLAEDVDDKVDEGKVRSPKYEEAFFRDGKKPRKWYERRRVWFSIFFGIVLRLWVILNVFPYVGLPWILCQVVVEVFEIKTARKYYRYPLHGHVMDLMLSFGFNEHLVYCAGRLAEIGSRVLDDSVVMFLSFLMVHYLCVHFGY